MNHKTTVGQECCGNIGLGVVPKPDGKRAVLLEVENGVTYFQTAQEIDYAIGALKRARAEAFPDA